MIDGAFADHDGFVKTVSEDPVSEAWEFLEETLAKKKRELLERSAQAGLSTAEAISIAMEIQNLALQMAKKIDKAIPNR